ncbi:MAG TPA: extracellular solute-binding protein [Marinilabiliaceae bacterium]|nr:extracellular solute-binding protein [Marinilabiliaceae bacterium]
MKKTLAFLIALVSITSAVFAGGSSDSSKGAVAPYDPNKQYTIRIGAFGDLETAYKAVIDSPDFKQKFPNIKIVFQTSDFGGHHSRLTTVLAAGEATNDIESLEIGYVAKFVEGGGLTDLAAAPFNGMTAGKDLVKFGMSNATTKKGELVAMPVDIAPAVLFYRKSLLDAAGVSFEGLKDWNEFIQVSKKLVKDRNKDGKIDQFAIPHANEVAMMPLNGGKGDWFNAKGQPLQPKEKFISALTLVKNIRDAGIDGDLGGWSGPWLQGFADGTVCSIVNGAWWGGALKTYVAPELSGDWRVTYLPGKVYASQGGTYLSIPAFVPNTQKAAAWEILKYLTTSPNAQLITFKTIDAFPALTTVFNDPVMNEPVEYFGGQKVRQIYADIAKNIPSAIVTEYDAIASAIFGNAVTDVLVNGKSAEEAYKTALNELSVLID